MKLTSLFNKITAALLVFAVSGSAGGAKNEKMNWFFSKPGNGERPTAVGGKIDPDEYGALWLGPEGDKTVYLTFDAGYANENVGKVLDTLEKHGAKAAFFILPGIIRNSPETVKRMVEGGHTLCNHSTHHGDVSKITGKDELDKELKGVEEAFYGLTGKELTKYFRPPEGAFSVKTLEMCRELGYTPVFWSYAYADWDNNAQPDPERSKEKLLNAAHDGMVLLLHPTGATNAEILDGVLTALEEKGYSFGTLDQLKEKMN
ncbi:MAG: polysaccharide deacetylase family protein [Clostridia bacterium]|nr:polysaccharide deacetylase family protein [Clostridia bacterium]